MAASLWPPLVLELDGGGSCLLQPQHTFSHGVGPAEARVGVDDERERRGRGDHPRLLHQLVERDDADIGHAKHARRQGRARQVGGLKTLPLDEPRRQRDRRPGDRDRRLADTAAKRGSW